MLDLITGRQLLAKVGQEHLLQYWDELSDQERNELLSEIEDLDISQACQYFQKAQENSEHNKNEIHIQQVPPDIYSSWQDTSADQLSEYRHIGLTEISNGSVGVILLAGGQGTRIGVPYPKGMYKIGLPSNFSLFEIQAKRILKLQSMALEKTGKKNHITWFIMTSEHTKHSTQTYFEENNYFGLDKRDVIFFEQGVLPCFTFDGKIILESKYQIAKAPDGNGGIYQALRKKGILTEMDNRGIKYIHVHGVDNVLVKVADPLFIGYCIKLQADSGNKVVEKKNPKEGLGVVCIAEGKFKVVEYSEISDTTAELREKNGKLAFRAGNICNHFFTSKFLQHIADNCETQLKLHIATKKIPYIDANGQKVKPDQPNGIKIEKFIFDVFEFSEKFVVWEVEREHDFTALKNSNAVSTENPITSCKALYNLHRTYIENAGGQVKPDANGSIVCEITPSVSYDGEGLKSLVHGKIFESPVLLQ